ncbi:ATP-binding protein [bacterium]|nr:ATP-binding protein [bacterium]
MLDTIRAKDLSRLHWKLTTNPIVGILGPRQCGKTTLAKQYIAWRSEPVVHFFDMEDPRDQSRLENPMMALEELTGLIVIDEIQLRPDLFSVLRVLADQKKERHFIILGSASQTLVAQSAETLAGRISYLELGGFTLELPGIDPKTLWERGGFPRSYLATSTAESYQWRQDFITTFLERDIPRLGIKIPARTLRQFWMMLAHYHGQTCNYSELGKSLDTSDNTIRRYLDILEGTFMIRLLRPYFYNTKKRLTKQPKIYFRDSGLLHTLLTLENYTDLSTHPKLGFSWEGFALEQLIEILQKRTEEIFFWKVSSGAELDLLTFEHGHRIGFEVKFGESPRLTPSMKSAVSELGLSTLYVITPGKESYPLSESVRVLPLNQVALRLSPQS